MSLQSRLEESILLNMWENPAADSHAIFRLVRLTTDLGSVGVRRIPHVGAVSLPVQGTRFHLYSTGKGNLHSLGLGTTYKQGTWYRLSDLVNDNTSLITVFSKGRLFSFDSVYVMMDSRLGLLIAVGIDANRSIFQDTLNENVFIRTYSNAIYKSDVNVNGTVKVVTRKVNDITTTKSFITSWINTKTNANIKTSLYVDGLLVDSLNGINKVGQVVQVIASPTVEYIDRLGINNMSAFTATMDGRRKIVLSLNDEAPMTFVDDIEFYIVVESKGVEYGVYLARLNYQDIMQLTFKDYAVDGGYFDSIKNALLNKLVDIDSDFKVVAYLRKTRDYKNYVLGSSRTLDLTRLPLEYRKDFLTGVNSVLDIWTANSLMQSKYNRFIDTEYHDLRALGYDNICARAGVTELVERTRKVGNFTLLPNRVESETGRLITFDSDGLMVDSFYDGNQYERNEPVDDPKLSAIWLPKSEYANAPCVSTLLAGNIDPLELELDIPFTIFFDNGGSTELAMIGVHYNHEISNDKQVITWIGGFAADFDRYVKNDLIRFEDTRELTLEELKEPIDLYNGSGQSFNPLDLKFHGVYLWLNGRFLTPGLDYIRSQSDEIFLSGHLTESLVTYTLTTLVCGQADIREAKSISTFDFMRTGVFSENSLYNLYKDRNKLFLIDGRVIKESDVIGDENYVGDDEGEVYDSNNGKPCTIVDRPNFVPEWLLSKYATSAVIDADTETTIRDFINANISSDMVGTAPSYVEALLELGADYIFPLNDEDDTTLNEVSDKVVDFEWVSSPANSVVYEVDSILPTVVDSKCVNFNDSGSGVNAKLVLNNFVDFIANKNFTMGVSIEVPSSNAGIGFDIIYNSHWHTDGFCLRYFEASQSLELRFLKVISPSTKYVEVITVPFTMLYNETLNFTVYCDGSVFGLVCNGQLLGEETITRPQAFTDTLNWLQIGSYLSNNCGYKASHFYVAKNTCMSLTDIQLLHGYLMSNSYSPVAVGTKYDTVSVLLQKLTDDISNSLISIPPATLSDAAFVTWVGDNYSEYLFSDIAKNGFDTDFVEIFPYRDVWNAPVMVGPEELAFLQRVDRTVLGNVVNSWSTLYNLIQPE